MKASLAVTTDVALFTIQDERLKVLLVRRGAKPHRGAWALPGGFVRPNEGLDECAKRELAEETGVSDVYLEQLYSFGAPDRDPRGRVITVAYYALIPADEVMVRAGSDADVAAWFPADDPPELAFDHGKILQVALDRLVAKAEYSTVAFQFLPEQFTLTEVQRMFEIIEQKELDKRNFRKFVLGLDLIEETGEMRSGGHHRPAKLYRLKRPDAVEIIK